MEDEVMDGNLERIRRLRQRMVAVIIKNEQILLIKRVIYQEDNDGLEDVFWTLPGGAQKCRETPIMALRRETLDETNIKIVHELPLFPVEDVPMPPGIPKNPCPPHQDEHYFLIDRWEGQPRVGKEFQKKMEENPRHRYFLDWVPLQEFMWKPNLRDRPGMRRLAGFLNVPVPPVVLHKTAPLIYV